MEELEPCPFCGGEAALETRSCFVLQVSIPKDEMARALEESE